MIPVLHKSVERSSAILHSFLLIEGFGCSTFSCKIRQRCSDQRTYLARSVVFTFCFFKNSFVISAVCLESLLRWKIPLLLSILRLGVLFSSRFSEYKLAFTVPFIFTVVQAHIGKLLVSCLSSQCVIFDQVDAKHAGPVLSRGSL